MIKNLAKKLTAFTDFADCVIVEAEFQRGNFNSGAEIVKKHSAMAILRAESKIARLSIKLISPRNKITAAVGSRIQNSEKIWRIFTATEIFNFADEIGDENPIHRLNPPIVPAFLILETLCNEFSPNFIKLKFKNFITAGEPLFLTTSGSRFEIKSAGVKKITGEIA